MDGFDRSHQRGPGPMRQTRAKRCRIAVTDLIGESCVSSDTDGVRHIPFDECFGVRKICGIHELHRIRRTSEESQVNVLIGATAVVGFEPFQICSERKPMM